MCTSNIGSVCWVCNEIEKRHSLERIISEKNQMLENEIEKRHSLERIISENNQMLENEIEKRHSLERIISEKNQMLENDIHIIKLTLGKISMELKEGLSHVDEELKDLKADFKEFVKGTMDNNSNKVDEMHTSLIGSGWYTTIKRVAGIVCSIASGLSYFFPQLHALDSLCSVNYYL